MCFFKATSHAQITANENLRKYLYFYLGLLAKVGDTPRPVDARSIIFEIFDIVLYFGDTPPPPPPTRWHPTGSVGTGSSPRRPLFIHQISFE